MRIKLFACGDIVNSKSNKFFVDKSIKKIIRNCEISICNLEAPVVIEKPNKIKKAGPHIKQNSESIKHLKDCGFDIVSLANNHIYDYGELSIRDTINTLDKYDIKYIGGGKNFDIAYKTLIIKKKEIKVGFIAACENEFGCLSEKEKRGGYAWIFHDLIEDNIRDLKKKCDYVIMMAHAGIENIEIPIKEWRNRYRRLCEVGVDILLGHHPHVPQGYENHYNSFIFYSLGNFYFDTSSFEFKSDDSYSLIFNLYKEKRIDFKIIYHKKKNNQTCLVDKGEVNFNINYLNNLLIDDYEEANENISVELWKKYYNSYYKVALDAFPIQANLLSKIKWLLKKLFFVKNQNNKNNLLLLHNIRIESHRFLVQRALSLISEKI